jgi:hypothetical protein
MLTACVDEDIGLAEDDRGGLRPGGAERRELAADRLGEGLREGRRPGAAHDERHVDGPVLAARFAELPRASRSAPAASRSAAGASTSRA